MRLLDVGVGTITHLAFSPLGTHLAASGFGGVGLGPWPALAEGRGPFATRRSQEMVAQVAWHPKGHVFAAANIDTFVQIWNTRLRLTHELGDLPGQQGQMLAVAYSPDGDKLAFGGGFWAQPGCTVVAWATSGHHLQHFEAHARQVGAILFFRNDVLITGSADKTLIVHPLGEPDELITVTKLPSPIQAIALQPNGNRLAVAAGNTIHLWQMGDDARPRVEGRLACRGHKGVARAISFSPDGRIVASAGEDGTLRYWDVDTGAAKACLDVGLNALRAVAFAPDGLTVVSGGDAGTIAIVDVDR